MCVWLTTVPINQFLLMALFMLNLSFFIFFDLFPFFFFLFPFCCARFSSVVIDLSTTTTLHYLLFYISFLVLPLSCRDRPDPLCIVTLMRFRDYNINIMS